ncbi:protein DpdG [Kitasatospora cineracea]|uniref:protein DpdG n=1 Tax=Kitasatospora cineracea TaxID=88074 RepID=UPI0036D9F047
MAYLNPTQTARPDFIWPVFRFMAVQQGSISQRRIIEFTAPESLGAGDSDVVMSLRTLGELRLLESEGRGDEAMWTLGAMAKGIAVDDYAMFQKRLRSALFVSSEPDGRDLVDSAAADLIRVLCWFLKSDPHTEWATLTSVQTDKTWPSDISSNDTRWGAFQSWGSAVGLTASAPHTANACIADCAIAVRQALEELLHPGQEKEALEVLRGLRSLIPVLPGGILAETFGFHHESDLEAGPAISFALRRWEIEGWLKLELRSDSQTQIKLFTPDSDFSLLCSTVKRLESAGA